MFLYRPSRNKLALLSLIVVQLCLIASYFLLFKSEAKETLNKISFLPKINVPDRPQRIGYYTSKDTVNLKRVSSRGFFLDFNSSMCFTEGTDIKTMIVIKGINWKCNCLQGWHGPDCGYPEVFFRALLAQKQPALKLKGPGPFQRRLIYIFKYDRCSENLADMRITALGDIVDVFVLYEADNYFQKHLKRKLFKEWQHKILYLPNSTDEAGVWRLVEGHLRGLRGDDFVISTPSSEVPDRASLIFLKFYENVPEPIHFRLKWSVFGFFWVHPKKTIISGGACTYSYLKNNLNNNLEALTSNNLSNNNKGIVLGDLNRTGGWFCEYCAAPEDIIEFLTSNSSSPLIDWEKIGTTKITRKFIENLIELGLYLDGKTELERGHRYSDVDFAPQYVLDNDFKFDFLLVNFYSQNEYYM